jgi:HK97 family phage major capsid protein
MLEEVKTIEQAAAQLKNDIKGVAEEAAKTAVKEVAGTVADVKSQVEGFAPKLKQIQDDFDKFALEVARNGGSQGKAGEPNGDEFLKEYTANLDKVKSRERGQAVEFNLSQKAAVVMLTGATLPGRIIPSQTGPLVGRENVFQHVRDLIAPGTITGPTLTYPRAIGIEGGPATTGEGQKKPQMSFTFEEVIGTVKKIPVYFKISTELAADAPAFVSYMQAQAAEAIKDVEDQQLLYGDNTGTNLQGIMPLATPFSGTGVAKVPNAQKIDVLRLAIAQVRRAKFRATAIMLNPDDCADLELQKDAEGRYLLPTILTGLMPQIGRVQIIEVDAILPGEFLVGAFDRGAQVFEREGLTIRIFDQNEDDAIKNLLTVVLEERLMQAVYRPNSFVKGNFDTAIAAINKPA